jgi:PAS domain S-box-containing protein
MILLDNETEKIIDVNDIMTDVFGYKYEEALQLRPEDISSGETPYTAQNFKKIIKHTRTKGEFNFEWQNKRKNGERFWTANTSKLVLLNGLEVIVILSHDIQSRKIKQLLLQNTIVERTREIHALNEKLALTIEELKITNEELEAYKDQLEKLVEIRTLELRNKEETLNYKIKFQKLVGEISSRFFNISPELVNDSIIATLQEISTFIEADCAFLAELSFTENQYQITHYWNNNKIAFEESFLRKAPLSEFSWWLNQLADKKYFILNSPEELPIDSFAQQIFKKSFLGSIVFVPIFYMGNVLGIIGFGTAKTHRIWSSDEISLGHVTGEVFINALKYKTSEKIIIEKERNYQEIFNATSEAIVIINANNSEIVDLNQAAIDLLEYSAKNVLSEPKVVNTNHPFLLKHEKVLEYLQKAIDDGFVVFEWQSHKSNEKEIWTEISMKRTILDGKLKIIAVLRDISERKKAQELIIQSEVRFRSIIQYLTDIIWIVDENISVQFESPSSWHTLGYEPGQLLGKSGLDIIHPEDLAIVISELNKVLLKKNDFLPTEIRLKHALGHWITLEVIANNMIDHPAIHGIILTGRDITERRHLEKKVLDAIISTEEREREKFARNLHDELGPLLSSIKMYVNSIKPINDKEKQDFIINQLKNILTEVIRSTKELSNDLSPHVLTNYGIVAALEWFINQLKPYILVKFESNFKDTRLAGNCELSLYRIIKELINNTLKHARATEITIQLHLVLNSIHLLYTDNGKGFQDNWNQNYEIKGMGMSSIISRCRSLNATNKFFNNAPNGMSFVMEFHLEEICTDSTL